MKAKNLEKICDEGKDVTPHLVLSKAIRPFIVNVASSTQARSITETNEHIGNSFVPAGCHIQTMC